MAIGVVSNAIPDGVMPARLASRFQRSESYDVQQNNYVDGATQVNLRSSISRKTWSLDERMDVADLAELRAFYIAHLGCVIPFTFYDPSETDPLFSSDPTGEALDGQYVVRFNTAWDQAINVGRLAGAISLTLLELA